ncbi:MULTISPECIES: membrane integrity-associated transporter subunit PqiC [unclassified Variovorax]|uniref:PqiC family protein n=1 Tax=unclassified Variovorax TaxID=663243 RepID=UPI001BD43850|nr:MULTISPECIES: PqiC family protein [unclassified Variovorax]
MKAPTSLIPLAAAIVAALAGCAASLPRFYTLASPSAATAAVAGSAPLWIEVAPLAVPERLARPQMVVRSAGVDAQVEVLEDSRWASSFESELRDALSSGIAGQLGALDGTRGGRPASAPVMRISVQVRRFDAVEGSRVEASLGWSARRAEQPRALVCQVNLSEPVSGPGIDAVAQSAQRLTANASAAIARGVAALQSNPDATCPI